MESEFVEWLRLRLPAGAAVEGGLGDDAAVLFPFANQCVVTSDMLMDGVDFVLGDVDPRRAGRKALAVNLSDLAAMAARPVAAIVSLALPRNGGATLARELYEGMLPLADEMDVVVAGGDTNSWDHPLVISVTLLGDAGSQGPLLRSGGIPGDEILVTGHFGGSLLGKHLDFQPRVPEAMKLRGAYDLHAAIDVSDGLGLDLSRLAKESGCGALIELDAIPVSADAVRFAASADDGLSARQHALADGEDFELVFTVSSQEAALLLNDQPLDVPLSRIGRLVDEPGLWQSTADGRVPLEPHGYQHQFEP